MNHIHPRAAFIALPLAFAAAAAMAQVRPAPAIAVPDEAERTGQAEQVRVLLVASRETTLSSAATARLKELPVSMGMTFGKDQVLVAFDCDEPQARLKIAQAELAGAVETQEARVRMQGLAQASDVEVALAAAQVAKGRAQVQLQQSQVEQCAIRAPWGGRVAKVHVKSFMSVTPGQPLVDIVMNGPLRLKVNVPSRLALRVYKGSPFSVTIDETGKSYEARVHAVNSRVDPVSQTLEVEAVVTKAWPELLPGMSGVANLHSLR